MSTSRREFLETGVLASGVVALGAAAPTFLTRTAAAAPAAGSRSGKDTLLVVVELTGGNDGLNTVVPFKDPEYAKLRPQLKLPASGLKKITDDLGLHPSLAGFAGLLEDNRLCVVQGVGYPNPTQSHFRSMDIWQAGSTAETLTEGWLGKALKGLPGGTLAFHLKAANQTSPLALEGAPARSPSIATLAEFQLQTAASSGADRKEQTRLIEEAARPRSGTPSLLDFVSRTASSTYASTRRLTEVARGYQPKVPYPATGLANRLKLAAQLIDADVGGRIFYVSIDGFDTHATQLPAHAALLSELSAAVTAFYRDLQARGHGDRLLVMTFSEFGRRAKENGSRGTDHGSGSQMFLIGGKVKSGVVGAHPALTDLPLGNLTFHTDFRQVYAAVLDRWLGVASKEVLGATFKPAPVLAG